MTSTSGNSSFNEVAASVDMALRGGDRRFALCKLQNLWAEGWHDQVTELVVTFKRDWGFTLTDEGVSDAD